MAATVPSSGVALTYEHLVSGAPVQGIDWTSIASAYNGLDGMCSTLIPACAPVVTIPGDDPLDPSGLSLSFTVWPRYQATHRLWLFSLGFPFPNVGRIGFKDPSGGLLVSSVISSCLIAHVETIASRTSGETTLTVLFGPDGDCALESISCIELSRPELATQLAPPTLADLTVADAGEDVSILRSNCPIADDLGGFGAGFVAREMDALRDRARRTGLFSIGAGADGNFSTTSSAFVKVLASQPIVLGRCLYNGQTQSVMQFGIRVGATSATGEVRITMASGATQTFPIPTGALAVVRGQLPIDCEDLSTSDGRRAGRDETVTIEVRRTGGTGTVSFYGGSGGEGAASSSPSPSAIMLASKRRLFGRGPLPKFMGAKRHRR